MLRAMCDNCILKKNDCNNCNHFDGSCKRFQMIGSDKPKTRIEPNHKIRPVQKSMSYVNPMAAVVRQMNAEWHDQFLKELEEAI